MFYIGVDHHKHNTYVTSLRHDGSRYLQRNLSARAEVLAAFFRDHPRPYVVGIEATYAWEYVADIVEAERQEIRVGHPLLLKAFARRHKKNDKIDSQLNAWLLYRGDFPAIKHPTKLARQQRDLYRQRMELVARRTSASARAKAQADRLGFQAEMNLSTLSGIAQFDALRSGAAHAAVWASHVELLRFLYHEIARLGKAIDEVAQLSPQVQWLMSVPGLGPYLALLIASEIFDVSRFASAKKLASYAGVAPASKASGGKVFPGHLAAGVNRYLRWAFCEAASHYARSCPPLLAKYQRLKRAKGWKTARLAVARHIAIVVYHLLKERRPYRPGPQPRTNPTRAQMGEATAQRPTTASRATTKDTAPADEGVAGLSWGLRGAKGSPAET